MKRNLSTLALACLIASNPLISVTGAIAQTAAFNPNVQGPQVPEGEWGLSRSKTLSDIKLPESGGFRVTDPRAIADIGYDPSRTWQKGDSAADVLRVGETDGLFKIKDLTPRQLAELAGTDVDALSLLDIYDQATLGDLIKINPDLANAPAASIPAIRDLVQGRYSSAIQTGILISEDYSDEVKDFLDERPELRNLPIKDVLAGDFRSSLPVAQATALRELQAKLPEQFKELPIKSLPALTDLTSGNIGGAVEKGVSISIDHFEQLERFYEKHPALKEVPIADVLNGRWDRVATQAEKYAFKKLANTIPESSQKFAGKALPAIQAARDGDFSRVYEIAGESIEAFNKILEDNPHLKNLPINELLRGDVQAALPKAQQVAIYEISKKLPDEYKGLPAQGLDALYDLKDGRWENAIEKGVKISGKYFNEIENFYKEHPELANVSISEVLSGDFDSAIDAGEAAALKRLEKVNPYLSDVPLGAIVRGNYEQVLQGGIQIGAKVALDKLIADNPALKDVALGALDNPRYSIGSVEGLADTAIGVATAIDSKALSKIPGLNKIPLDFINANNISALLKGDLFGRIDLVYGEAEGLTRNALSGFTRGKRFTPTNCNAETDSNSDHCAHVELRDYGGAFGSRGKSLLGKQFTTKYHKGKGGWGFLSKVQDEEGAGISPWGVSAKTQNLKLVITKTSETDGEQTETASGFKVYTKSGYAEFGLTFGICIKTLFIDTCTASFIELPTEFIPKDLIDFKVAEGGRVLIATTSPPPRIPRSLINRYRQQYGIGNQYCDIPPDSDSEEGHKDYDEQSELVEFTDGDDYTQRLHPEAYEAFRELQEAAAKDGVDLQSQIAYRSVEDQQELWEAAIAEYGSEEEAAKRVAPPGQSEHHTGYVVDFKGSRSGLLDESDPAYPWLQENAEKYGFDLSFPEGNSAGVQFEPWHWRYTGSEKARQALRLDDSNTQVASELGDGEPQVAAGTGDSAIASVRAPETETEQFVAKSAALANKYGIDPVDLLTVMSFETKGTLDPSITNSIGATGLIQFIPSTAIGLGTTTAELRQMSRVEQLDWVDRYFASVGIQPGDNLGTIYASILTGSRVGNRNSSDGSFTVNTALQAMAAHRQRAIALIQGAENLDTSSYQFASAGTPCIASSGGVQATGPFSQGDGTTRGNFINPAPGPITSRYGPRTHPVTGELQKPHKGIDIGLPIGSPVKAADGGVVIYNYNECTDNARATSCGGPDTDGLGRRSGFGNRVEIRHADGSTTAYNHLETALPPVGAKVSQGQVIGTVGSTGISTGPHLDFQIYPDGVNDADPELFIDFR